MSSESTLWRKLVSEFEVGLREDLSGMRPRRGGSQRGAVRTRGTVRLKRRAQLPSEPLEPATRVVVEVPKGGDFPREDEVRSKLKLKGVLDIYYVVRGKHWAALRPRELNPDDQEYYQEHELILRNLKPQFALMLSTKTRPSWYNEKTTKLIKW